MADATDRTSILIVDDSPEKIVALESILDDPGLGLHVPLDRLDGARRALCVETSPPQHPDP